ncbi:MAG: metallophosphoesterase [Phycisphaeraceae bacterium]|nr:metallophosphoesterase [Phycisphaeraceae bacterium]
MRCVLLGDIHLYRLRLPLWRLLSKRLLGQTNLWLRRRHRFDGNLLGPVVEHVLSLKPDRVLLSGDLTTTALPGEFEDASKALAPLTEKVETVATPGNHDRYTYPSAWQCRMERMLSSLCPTRYPHMVELTEHWRLLVLDSAAPRLLSSRGRVGRKQRDDIRASLGLLSKDSGLLVLCHYPVVEPAQLHPMKWQHRLADADELCGVLLECAARVVFLHGHVHRPWHWQGNVAPGRNWIDINAGSPTFRHPATPHGQGFWHLDLLPKANLECTHHLFDGRQWRSTTLKPPIPTWWTL